MLKQKQSFFAMSLVLQLEGLKVFREVGRKI